MNSYKLEIIKGTSYFVLEELRAKIKEDLLNLVVLEKEIRFDSSIEDIDDFRILKSPLRVTKNNRLTRNLFRREWKVASVPASINPSLAYIMCLVANLDSNDVVWDPFCGSGTIPLTCLNYFNIKKAYASDISGKSIDLTIENTKASTFEKSKFIAFRSNISQVKFKNREVTKIITNLPFGIRVGDHSQNIKIYENLFQKAKNEMKTKSKVILLSPEKKLVSDLVNKYSFKILLEVKIEQGKLYPSIYKIEI